jgi:hypothetical protein
MKTLSSQTSELIDQELRSIPEKYQKDFNSIHEGYAVILEEVRELEQEVFFGEKKAREPFKNDLSKEWAKAQAESLHKERLREECVQIAAMCARFIQELCKPS